MYEILVKSGARPANSKVAIDGLGELTVGHWTVVSDAQARKFRHAHVHGKTILQAFAKDKNVEVRTYEPPQDDPADKPKLPKPADAPKTVESPAGDKQIEAVNKNEEGK